MSKVGFLLALVVFFAYAAPVSAATPAEQSREKSSYSNPVNSLLFSSEGQFKLDARFKAGFEHLDVNFDLPLPLTPDWIGAEIAFTSPITLKLKDADFWTCGLDTELTIQDKFGIFLNGHTAIPRTVRVDMSQDPFLLPVEWRDTDLMWYSVETGLAYRFHRQISFLAGFRWSHLSLDLGNPNDTLGLIPLFQRIFGDLYTSDMTTDLYIPYLGVRVDPLENVRLRLTFLYSPLAFADVTQTFNYRYNLTPTGPFFFQREKYSMSDFGNFLEGGLEYETPLFHGMAIGLWVKGNYMRVRGDGTQESVRTASDPVFSAIVGTGSAGATGHLDVSSIAGGVTISF